MRKPISKQVCGVLFYIEVLMKTLIKQLSIFYVLLFLLTPLSVVAQSQVNDVAWETWRTKAPPKDQPPINCAVKFAELDYVGVKFTGEAICVAASDEKEASQRCPSGTYYINPGNPQYQKKINGTRSRNPDGYYYCAKGTTRNKKYEACVNIAPKESEYVSRDPKVVFEWRKGAGATSDGDCYCGQRGSATGFRECAQEMPMFEDRCKSIGLTSPNMDDFNKIQDQKERDRLSCTLSCKCNDGRIFDLGAAEAKCKEEPVPPTPPKDVAATVEAPKPPPPPARPASVDDTLDAALKSCVDTWKDNAKKCKDASELAKSECRSQDKSKKEAQEETSKVVDAASKAYISSKTGTGAQQECFTGSVIANFTKDLLNQTSENCGTSSSACTTACNIDDLNKERQRCHGLLTEVIRTRYAGEPPDSNANSNYFTEGERTVNEVTTQGAAICGEAGKKDKSMIEAALTGVGKSMAASVSCMCKLSSGATGSCDQIVPPSNCTTNPDLPGCRQYTALGVCTPGSGYDAKLCSCQLNPKGAGCPGGEVSGGLSNFATGANLNPQTGDVAVGTPVGSELKPGVADLSGAQPTDGPAGNLKLEPSKSGGPGNNASGGGPGGGGPGGGDVPPEATPEEEKTGIGGLFGAAKTFVSNAFKSKKSSGNGNLNDDPKSKFDASKFRPIRGVAGKSGVGSKNQDIWRMVNTCLYSETCQSNSNSFLESPLKHK